MRSQTSAVDCAVCQRLIIDQAYACGVCADDLRVELGKVAGLAAELPAVIARQTATGAPTGVFARAAEIALPMNWTASIVDGSLRNTLSTWVRHIAEERGQIIDCDSTPAAMASWLLDRVEWIRHRPEADQIIDELTYIVGELRRAVDRPADRWYAGPCDECGDDLYARQNAAQVECRACGAVYDVTARRDWLLAAAEDTVGGPAMISAALSVLNAPVDAARIRKWAERGRLTQYATDARGRALYRIGDVRALVSQAGTQNCVA